MERRAREPIVPLRLFGTRMVLAAVVTGALKGWRRWAYAFVFMFGALIFSFLKMPAPKVPFFTDGWTTTLNVYSQVGLVTLVGLVSKNGILIVEFANKLQEAGLSKIEAVKSAACRRIIFDSSVMCTFPLDVVGMESPAGLLSAVSGQHLDVPIAYETLRPLGSSPGCGGIRIVDETTDVVAMTIEIAEFFMREQCGQCPPCRMQTNQFVHVLQGVQRGLGPGYADKLSRR